MKSPVLIALGAERVDCGRPGIRPQSPSALRPQIGFGPHNEIRPGPNIDSHGLHNHSILALGPDRVRDEFKVVCFALNPDGIPRLSRAAVVLQGVFPKSVAARGVGSNFIAKIDASMAISTYGVPNKDVICILMP